MIQTNLNVFLTKTMTFNVLIWGLQKITLLIFVNWGLPVGSQFNQDIRTSRQELEPVSHPTRKQHEFVSKQSAAQTLSNLTDSQLPRKLVSSSVSKLD